MWNPEAAARALATPLPHDIQKRKQAGDLNGARLAIDKRLEGDLPRALRDRLLYERERLHLIPMQYTLTRAEALCGLCERMPGMTPERFDEWEALGRMDFCWLNGEKRYLHNLPASVEKGFAAPEPDDPSALRRARDITAMKRDGRMRRRIALRASIRARDDAFVPGETYRAHLPFPIPCAQQSGVELLRAEPPCLPDQADALQRTAFFETRLFENRAFAVEYAYDSETVYVDALHGALPHAHVYPNARPATEDDIAQATPFMLFTPALRALCAELSGGEREPLLLARRFYDYVTRNVTYSYMPEYLLLEDPGQYALVNQKGDCGLQALLFILLCRIAGIPARWQSGLVIDADGAGNHDWAQFYAEPFGWLFCDLSMGGSAWRRGDEEAHGFYFGNVDAMRMVANRAFQRPLKPAKRHIRTDPYDNQRGELECGSRGFRVYELETKVTVLEPAEVTKASS